MRFVNIVFIAVVMACVAFPLVFADKAGGGISVEENRVKAERPRLRQGFGSTQYTEQFEDWINDNAAGRSTANVFNTHIHYYLFGSSTQQSMVLSESGWIYYCNDQILRDFQNQPLNDWEREDMDMRVDALNALQASLEQEGIAFLGVLVPDKKTVYPEHYMRSVLKADRISRREIFMEEMGGVPWYIDLTQGLQEAKSEAKVYFSRVDSGHWNDYGAYVGYRQMMQALEQFDLAPRSLDYSDFIIEAYVTHGKKYHLTVPKKEHVEWGYRFTLKTPADVVEDPEFFDSFPYLSFSGDKEAWAKRYINPNSSLPKVLFVGDSYSSWLFPYLNQSFSEVTFLHIWDAAHILTVAQACEPDIVIYENCERVSEIVKYAHPAPQ